MTAAPTAGGVVTSGVGVAGVGVGLLGMFGPVRVVHVGWLLPLSGVHIELDRLGGFFMALTGAVAAPVGCYLIGYVRREHLGRVPMAVVPLFVAAMLLVPAAGSVTTFLLAWELMAIASLILVLSEHARPQVRSAGLWYAVMTQLGFIAILVGLVVLAAAGGSDRFAGLGAVCDGVRAAVFMLTLVGFGSKAGLVPLHAWLPRAHPEAPSPVSALMSAAMVNLGIYGIVRFDLQLLGPGPRWWGLALLAVGGTSALYGVLQASVAADLKRLLAYSTTENMGLITLALGAATLFADTGAYGPASIAAAAAMLHMIAHAAFKSLAFMAAGSVLAATGLRDLDLLGGLARRMPATTVFFGVAALGACGLPLGAGFVSEWLLVQSLIHAAPGHDPIVALTTPLAVGVVALATGLSVAAMTKAFGIGFLARPRSTQAEAAREAPASMRAGMAIAAGACLVLAVAPLLVAPMVRRAAATLPAAVALYGRADHLPDRGRRRDRTAPLYAGGRGGGRHGRAAAPCPHRQRAPLPGLRAVVRLPAMSGSIAPGVIAAAVLAAALAVAVLARWRFRRRPAPARLPLWACGAADLTVRMQYTATSFAEPLQRVFGDVLRPDTDIEVTHTAESRYMAERITYRTAVADAIEQRLYTPVVGAVAAMAELLRRAHTGSVHRYLAYGALGVLIVLVVARCT
nr:proton-conducting transporter membrane subunit [Mycobacterium tuberculosis]